MATVVCRKKCLKDGLLRRVGELMEVADKKKVKALLESGNWEKVVSLEDIEEAMATTDNSKKSGAAK